MTSQPDCSRPAPRHRVLTAALYALVVLALAGAAACKDSLAANDGSLFFTVDGVTCSGAGNLQFFVDGVSRGTQILSAGQKSTAFTVAPGGHTASAREAAAGGYIWPTQNFTMAASGSYTRLLTC